MSIEPRYLSADMDKPPIKLLEGSERVQEALRVMGSNPYEPRVLSQARGMIPIFLPIGALATGTGLPMALDTDPSEGINNIVYGWIVIAFFLGVVFWILGDATFRRYGVDHDKVWARFGPFYREIRFADITRLNFNMDRYDIWAGKTKIKIYYHKYDYAPLYIRLLEELHHHKFRLNGVNTTDPNWEQQAQHWRNILSGDLWLDHRDFYDTHPQHLAHLNTLISPPDHYDD